MCEHCHLFGLSGLVMQPHEFVEPLLEQIRILPQRLLQCESPMCHHTPVRDVTLIPEICRAGYKISGLLF